MVEGCSENQADDKVSHCYTVTFSSMYCQANGQERETTGGCDPSKLKICSWITWFPAIKHGGIYKNAILLT